MNYSDIIVLHPIDSDIISYIQLEFMIFFFGTRCSNFTLGYHFLFLIQLSIYCVSVLFKFCRFWKAEIFMKNSLVGQSKMHITSIPTGQPAWASAVMEVQARKGEVDTLRGNQGGRSGGAEVKGWGWLSEDCQRLVQGGSQLVQG